LDPHNISALAKLNWPTASISGIHALLLLFTKALVDYLSPNSMEKP
jgi:hypothetical protein